MSWSDGRTRSIYVIKNTKTNRLYVGCSTNYHIRMEVHFRNLRGRRHPIDEMQEDFNKYGEKAFVSQILRECNNKKEASRLEAFYMSILNTHDRRYGYNYKDKKGTGWKAEKCRLRMSPYEYCHIKEGDEIP